MTARILRSPVREIAGLFLGLGVGLILVATLQPFGALFGTRSPAAGYGSASYGNSGSGTTGSGTTGAAGTGTAGQASIGAVPTALDAEWTAASAQSTCAGWAGGDGMSGVRLNSTQVAWFFSDTYLGPAGPGVNFSHASGLVHNSVVVQTAGRQGSRFVTLTGGGTCDYSKHPASVVAPPRAPGRPSTRYWAEGGIKVGATVVVFYNRYSPGNIPYVPLGTVIATYSAASLAAAGRGSAQGAVTTPALISLPYYLPHGAHSPIVWGAAVLRTGNTVYVYGTDMPSTQVLDRQLYVARVPASRLTDFSAWRFYAGPGRWTAAQRKAKPVRSGNSALGVSTGFSVVQAGKRYWLIQADPIAGSQDIDAHPGATPWGPFDPAAKVVLYADPGIGLDAAHDYRLMYEARAEPAVSPTGSVVISYNVNSLGISAGCTPMSWFDSTVTVPRFVSVPLAVLAADVAHGKGDTGPAAWKGLTGQSALAGQVTAGPSDYPQVSAGDPGQWFDEWDYPGLCPPIPGLATASATVQSSTVTLSWPDAGLGLAYLVYLRGPGSDKYVLRQTVPWVLTLPGATPITATLPGLAAGTYEAKIVPLNLSMNKGQFVTLTFNVA
jgi:hypothetical protein